MRFDETPIPGVLLITPDVFEDSRGFFMETWNARDFERGGPAAEFVQDNLSFSTRHTLRGLHYQIRQSQGKLVRVVLGEVFDVIVDLRRSSPTFGKWYGVTLSAENRQGLWIPPGLAHGFLVTSENAAFEYKCTDYYAPEHERTICWDDATLGIDWPLPNEAKPLLSDRDAAAPALHESETFP